MAVAAIRNLPSPQDTGLICLCSAWLGAIPGVVAEIPWLAGAGAVLVGTFVPVAVICYKALSCWDHSPIAQIIRIAVSIFAGFSAGFAATSLVGLTLTVQEAGLLLGGISLFVLFLLGSFAACAPSPW